MGHGTSHRIDCQKGDINSSDHFPQVYFSPGNKKPLTSGVRATVRVEVPVSRHHPKSSSDLSLFKPFCHMHEVVCGLNILPVY